MEITIGPEEANQRFDRFLRKYFKKNVEIGLNDIFAWIRKGVIKVNKRKKSPEIKLVEGDIITINIPTETLQPLKKNPLLQLLGKEEKKKKIDNEVIKRAILFEDTNRIFWNKPPGIVVHPGNKHLEDLTMNDYLEEYAGRNKSLTFKPAFCFRLDKDTSGVIVAAKTYESLQELNKLIRDRKVEKTYCCIVLGTFPEMVTIDKPLFKGFNKKAGRAQTFVNSEQGSPAITIASRLLTVEAAYLGTISFVKVRILTGRMHQIRTHLSHIHYPIIGDIMYGNQRTNRLVAEKYGIVRQLLHSFHYSFFDRFSNRKIGVSAPLPEDFKKFISNSDERKHLAAVIGRSEGRHKIRETSDDHDY